MSTGASQIEFDSSAMAPPPSVNVAASVVELTEGNEAEVLRFLSARPIHTVFMAGLILDNGMVSSFNRGSFFGCRSDDGRLEGVALIGHATIFETESEDCLRAFAQLARNHSPAHLIRGEQQKVESFWGFYAAGNPIPHLLCGELLLELKTILAPLEAVVGLRQATIADLEMIINVNASMACNESGMNPLAKDPQGFRERAARRISKGRIWVWIDDNRLLFKTDIIAETPETTYLEGVYVDPRNRGKGYGLRCLSQLAGLLLARTKSVCLTVNEKSVGPQEFYRRSGYELVGRYDTIYLQK